MNKTAFRLKKAGKSYHEEKASSPIDFSVELLRPALKEAVIQANQLALPKERVLKEFTKFLEDEK